MLNTLQFNMSVPTPYVFMRRFLKAAQSDRKVSSDRVLGIFDILDCYVLLTLWYTPFTTA